MYVDWFNNVPVLLLFLVLVEIKRMIEDVGTCSLMLFGRFPPYKQYQSLVSDVVQCTSVNNVQQCWLCRLILCRELCH